MTVPGAEGAFDALCTAEADLILVDGWPRAREACSTLLQMLSRDPRTAGMPIVLCSGDPRALEDNATWLQAQGILTLPKPFDLEDLFDAIDGRLRAQRDPHRLSSF